MPPAGAKPKYRRFRRRRRLAGFALVASLAGVVFGGLLFASVVSAHLQLSALHGAQKNPVENFGDYWTVGPNWYVRYIVQADRVSVDSAA